MRTPVSTLIGRCQLCGTDGSVAQMNSVWWNRREIRYHSVCGTCSHLFERSSLRPHPFRQSSVSSLATTGWWINRVQWSPEGGADGRGRFLHPAEVADRVRQMRGVAYLSPDVTEEQLAPRRALLRSDGPALDAASVFTAEMLALGARQEELEEREGRREQRRISRRRRREADEVLGPVLQSEPPKEVKEEPAVQVVAAVVEVEARERVARLQGTAAWGRLTGEQQNEVGALLTADAVAAAERLANYIAAAVERPKPAVGTPATEPTEIPDGQVPCRRCGETIEERDAWKIVWQWRKGGEEWVPAALADIDIFEKYVKSGPWPLCSSCGREARELVVGLRNRHGWQSNPYWTHRFVDPPKPSTPAIEATVPLPAVA